MERKIIVIIVLLIMLSFLAGFFINQIAFTGRVVQEQQVEPEQSYWTKAICNSDNECIDVKVVCENGIAKSVEPVSPLIQHDANQGEICLKNYAENMAVKGIEPSVPAL